VRVKIEDELDEFFAYQSASEQPATPTATPPTTPPMTPEDGQ
jgi:hypothetical protein